MFFNKSTDKKHRHKLNTIRSADRQTAL